MIYYAKTHVGKIRKNNEDCFFAPTDYNGFFAVVADGMGGHNAGEVASKIVVDTIIKTLSSSKPQDIKKEDIKRMLSIANENVRKDSDNNVERRGMGSTATLAVFNDNHAMIGHVGDSRAYLFREGVLTQITKDHSYVQLLIDNGYISKEDALHHPKKNMITRAIGIETEIEVDVYTEILEKDDYILLCSDGLNVAVTDDNIAEILNSGIEFATEGLVEAALQGGGFDNITVVIARMGGGDCI